MQNQSAIDATLDLYRRFWSGQQAGPLLTVCNAPTYRQNADLDAMVEQACQCLAADMRDGQNALPTFCPDFGTVSLPAMWGGQRIPARDGGAIHIHPIARNLHDLERLPKPCPYEQSDFALAADLFHQIRQRLQCDRLYTRTPDLQGPMNTLGLIMEQTELILALYEAPDLIHHVLDHITEVTIDCLHRYRESVGADRVLGNLWPYVALPDGVGIGITQDYMPLLSPDLYAQFELPRLKRIADAFGGVFIHCCGEFRQHLPALATAEFKIWGVEVHYPCTRLWDVQAALGPDLAYVPYVAPTGQAEYPTLVSFLRSLARRGDVNLSRLWVPVARQWFSPQELQALQQWADQAPVASRR